ncbi:MAG: SAM-dependent chlorinase/fluorinase, partial [Nitrospirae bacterium]|nr:SAM-dependent chlorinase/fluorinase [Nitrospirota bacterium]
MLEKPFITLTTDFGLKDPFAGIMKGVILKINPEVRVIDITHNVSPQNIFEASQILAMSYKYFPPTTIHMIIVDPGVGAKRRPILVVTDDYYFIGPDNGVFTPVFDIPTHILKVIHITAEHYFLPHMSSTFHGRDIFAPVAAWLSKGIESSKFGEEITDYATLQIPKLQKVTKTAIEGEIVYIDNFGNAITNITRENLDELYTELPDGILKILYKGQQSRLLNYDSE